jgi:hypothetical protein
MNIVEDSSDSGLGVGPSRRGFLEGIGTTAFLLAFQLRSAPDARVNRQGSPGNSTPSLLSARTTSSPRSLRKPRVVRGTRLV